MKVITGGRQSGKTTEAIKLANEENAHLVVHTQERARQVEQNNDYPDLDRDPVTWRELERGPRGSYPSRVVIDDLERFLNHVTQVDVVGAAATVDETVLLGDTHAGE